MPSIAYNGQKYGINGANGKNVVVAKIEPIIGGNRVTFLYYDDNNVQKRDSLEIMNGEKGTSIIGARIIDNNELILTLSDMSEISAGNITIDSDNLDLEGYYDSITIDSMFERQKKELELYVDKKVEEKLSETIDTVSSDDIFILFA